MVSCNTPRSQKKVTKNERTTLFKSKHIDTSDIILPNLIIKILNSHYIPLNHWTVTNFSFRCMSMSMSFYFSSYNNHCHHRKQYIFLVAIIMAIMENNIRAATTYS
jgi:hypothetical protein